MATRNTTPRAPRGDKTAIAKQAAVEKQRKADSRAALKAAKIAEQIAATPVVEAPSPESVDALRAQRAEQDRLNRVATAEADAEATGKPVAELLADMGCDAEGRILESNEKTRYSGPMLALVAARKAYVKGANGNPHCSDDLATLCGAYSRETVVAAMVAALGLPGNPYLALNPGQQSMNLRNKARHALKAGTVKIADIDACLRAQSALRVAAKA